MKGLRSAAAIVLLILAVSTALAKDYGAKQAVRDLEAAFKIKEARELDKLLSRIKSAEDPLSIGDAQTAAARARQLQRIGPKRLPRLEEMHQGAMNFEYTVRTKKTKYKNFALLDLPRGLSAGTPVPLVIGLHSQLGTAWYELSGLRKCIRSTRDHPLRNCILACPQALNRGNTAEDPTKTAPKKGPRRYFGWGPDIEGIQTITNLIDELLASYNINPDRIYITGIGMGGEAAFHLAQLRPALFAALCVRDALPAYYFDDLKASETVEYAELLKSGKLAEQKISFPWSGCYLYTPISWVHADGDRKYLTRFARQARDEMIAAGVPLTYHEYKGFHGSADLQLVSKALAEMAKVIRRDSPPAVACRTVREGKGLIGNRRNRWLVIDRDKTTGKKADWFYRYVAGGYAKVTCDPEANSLTVESNGASSITVYLNDAMLDLGRAITIVVNGKDRGTRTVKRLNSTLLRTAWKFRHSGEVYCASLTIKTG